VRRRDAGDCASSDGQRRVKQYPKIANERDSGLRVSLWVRSERGFAENPSTRRRRE
jgi:hypothetical protein